MKNKIAFMLITALLLALVTPWVQVNAATNSNQGFDVSSHNGTVDWSQIPAEQYQFVMIRSGLGQNNVVTNQDGTPISTPDTDTQFEENYQGAGSLGLKRGIYHLCCTRTVEGAIAEANSCLEILNGRELEYPVAYDMEAAGTFSTGKENVTAMALAFCKVISEAGYTPMIYGNVGDLNTYFDWNQLTGIKIWAAHYAASSGLKQGKCDIWQYSQTGSVPGANTDKGYCDLNCSYMEASAVAMSLTTVTIGRGESYVPVVTMVPANCTDTKTFASEDSTIAKVTVNTGRITGVSVGTTNITVTTGSGKTAVIQVTVKKAPGQIKLNQTKKTLKKGGAFQINTTLPFNTASNKMTFQSGNTKVATVSATGLVKAKKAGTVKITVTTFNGKKAVLTLTVKN